MCYNSDTFIHKQKMIFWIDMGDDNNPTIPKKKRPWLIVSNDEINKTSANLTAVPIYTRDEATKSTHVHMKQGERDVVIVCEDIMSIPRYNIKPSNYAGCISDEIWEKVHTAILSQFSDNKVNIRESINEILSNKEVTNTIIDAIINMYRKNIDDNISAIVTIPNATKNNIKKSENNINIDTHVKVKRGAGSKHIPETMFNEYIEDYERFIRGEVDLAFFNKKYKNYFTNPASKRNLADRAYRIRTKLNVNPRKSNTNTSNDKISEGIENLKQKFKTYGPRGKCMSIEVAQEYLKDCETTPLEELNKKYAEYGYVSSHTELAKRKYALKKRLKKEANIPIV